MEPSIHSAIAGIIALATLSFCACSGADDDQSVPGPDDQGAAGAASSGGLGAGGSPLYPPGLPAGCAIESYPGQVVPLDMHIMLDRSSSMNDVEGDSSKWEQVRAAIAEFMTMEDAADLGMAMSFFPTRFDEAAPSSCQGPSDCLPFTDACEAGVCVIPDPDATSCWVSDYSAPAVPMASLPGVASQILAAMDASVVEGLTPMGPALAAALEYAGQWSKNEPEHITAVVLATDGYPTKCVPQDIEEVAALASSAFHDDGIRTFVIGMGNLASLNLIAQEGGTGEAILVGNGNTGAEFLAALDSIRGSLGCNYMIPVPNEGEPHPDQLNVGITSDDDVEMLPRVNSEADCGADPGYFLDDPDDPTHLTLCSASCDRLQNAANGVEIVIGCNAIIK